MCRFNTSLFGELLNVDRELQFKKASRKKCTTGESIGFLDFPGESLGFCVTKACYPRWWFFGSISTRGSVKALAPGQKKCGSARIPDANYSIFCFHQEIELDVLKFQKPFHLPPAFGVMNRHNFTFTTLPWLTTSQLCFMAPLFFWSEGFFGSQRPLPGGLKATMLRCCLTPIAFKHPNRGTSITYQFSKSKNSVDFGNVGLLPGIWSVFQSKPML